MALAETELGVLGSILSLALGPPHQPHEQR